MELNRIGELFDYSQELEDGNILYCTKTEKTNGALDLMVTVQDKERVNLCLCSCTLRDAEKSNDSIVYQMKDIDNFIKYNQLVTNTFIELING